MRIISHTSGMASASGGSGGGSGGRALDDGLYSRQRAALGDMAMQRIAQAEVLLVGLAGCGVETAKNLALAGLHRLWLCDPTACEPHDQAAQFYITDEDIQQRRTR